MNFIRKNILLISICLGFVLLLIGGVLLLMRQYSASETTAEKLNEQQSIRAGLLKEKIHLTQRNVEKMKENVAAQQGEIEKIAKLFAQSSVAIKPMNGNEFYNYKYNVMKELMGKLRQNFIAIPDHFQFGFETYQNKPPEDVHTPLLQKQLEVIRELMLICASSQVEEIKQIKRVEFESDPESTLTHDPSKEPLISLGSEFSIVENPGNDYLYSVMPFDLELLCFPESFRSFLNELARSKYLFIPRVVRVENPQKGKLSAVIQNEVRKPTQPTEADIDAMLNAQKEKPKTEGDNKTAIIDPVSAPYIIGNEKITVRMRIYWLDMTSRDSGNNKASVDKTRKKGKVTKP